MSIKAMTLVWERSHQSGSDLLLMLAIADYARDDGTGAWPSLTTLAKKARMSRGNVIRRLQRLEEAGELIIHRSEGPHGVNLYDINLPASSVEATRVVASTPPEVVASTPPNPSFEPSFNPHAPSPKKNGDGGMPLSHTSDLPGVEIQRTLLFAGGAATVRTAEEDIKRASWRIPTDELRWATAQFMAASGLPVPYDKIGRRSWLAGLQEHLDTFGVEFLKKHYARTVTDMRSKGLIVAQPQSLTKFLLDLKATERSPANIIIEDGKRVRIVK